MSELDRSIFRTDRSASYQRRSYSASPLDQRGGISSTPPRATAPHHEPEIHNAEASRRLPDVLTSQDLARFGRHLKRMIATGGHSWAFGEHRPLDAVVKHLPPVLQAQVAAYRRGALVQRLAFGGIAAVLALTIAIPVLNNFINTHRYDLSDATSQLLGPTDSSLVSKITYDSQSNSYYFNKTGIQTDVNSPAAALAAQVGGSSQDNKSLYSVKLPTDPTKGITYYDDNLNLSFSLTPQLKLMAPQEEQGRVVYPAGNGIQDVFTTKNNGLKDDIVLTKVGADTESYTYDLNLPNTLEAKMIDGTGEVGIYSADPALYNNITFGDSASKADVMKARENGAKNNLVFVLPAPTIKEYSTKTHASVVAPAAAHFILSADGKHLTVDASGLSTLSYPLTIDPSVVTTSTSDFGTGNNDDNNINYSTANQISRGAVTGGTLNSASGSWSGATSLPASRGNATSVAYNGYVYEIGGGNPTASAVVDYAPINSNGTLGSWNPTTSLPLATTAATSVAYNGYVYEIGGNNGSVTTTVDYAPINSNGTLGSWNPTTVLPTATSQASSVVYNGYVYEMGNFNGGLGSTTVDYAPVKADGTLGSWNPTTVLPVANYNATSVVFNGYVYEIGGSGSGRGSVVNYALINADGTLGSWATTTSLPASTAQSPATVYGGYVYLMNVNGAATVDYAPINANGSIGAWTATSSLPGVNFLATAVAYNGYVYEIGGGSTGTYTTTVDYAQIDAAGNTAATSWTTSGQTILHSEGGMCAVAYNGYLYYFGGYDGTSYYNTTQYAALNSDGSIGAWTTATNTFTTARTKGICAAYNGYLYFGSGWSLTTTWYNDLQQSAIGSSGAPGVWSAESNTLPLTVYGSSAVAYNGYLYMIGGESTGPATNGSVYYSALNSSTGATGTWTSATSLNSATDYATALVYNNYLYLVGGGNDSGATNGYGTIEYIPINTSNGSLTGSWTTQAYSPTARVQAGAAIWNGYLYMYGGWDGNTNFYADSDYAPLNANGSIGTWTAGASISTSRYTPGAASYDGFLYLIGGRRSSAPAYGNDTQYIALNNGGTGTSGSWTQATNNLLGPYPSFSGMRDSITAGANGFLYVIGGEPNTNVTSTGSATNAVYYAPINADGSPGTWTSTSSMNYTRASGTAISYNGYMYVFGGYPSGGTNNYDVEYALICTASNSGAGGCSGTPGTLGTWTLGTNFTNTAMQSNLGAVEWNGYFYVMGGNNSGGPASTVDYAPINANGSVGTWTATSSLITGVNIADQVVVNNGYIYVVGGIAAGSTPMGDIQYAQINPSTHAVGSFTDLPNALPYSQWYAGDVVAVDGYIYLSNGLGYQQGTSTGRGDTFYAAFGPNGSIGSWQHSSIMPTTHYASGGTYYNGYFYVVGGYKNTGPTYYPDIEFAPINAIPEVGHYSKLFDLGSATNTVYGITYNGFLGGGGLANISYKIAGSNAVLSSTGSNAFSLIPSTCPTGTAATTTRYVLVNLALDDSQNMTFPDVAGTAANVTDFTVNYSAAIHPTPQTRLRGGQTLKNGTLTALDTCLP